MVGILLTLRSHGTGRLQTFLLGAMDCRRMPLWAWFVALGVMPAVMILSATVIEWAGEALPAPEIGIVQTLVLFSVFLLAGISEELGWTGYLARELLKNYHLIIVGAIIGALSVIWHLVPLTQAGRDLSWIMWWAAGTVAARVIITCLYVDGGQSVFATALFHAMSNLSWMLFPIKGSHYDPASVAGLLIILTCLTLGARRCFTTAAMASFQQHT